MERITSRTNSLITHIRKLGSDRKYRRTSGQMLCEGPKMLAEALQWGAKVETVLWADTVTEHVELPETARQVEVPSELLKSIAPTQTPQGVLFLCALGTEEMEFTGDRYLVLDGLQDPGNVGTLWRTADAFGADGLILLPGCADPFSPKTLRATMGACFRLPIWEGSLEDCRARLEKAGLPLYATALREDTMDLRGTDLTRAAVVIGSEGKGVSRDVLEVSAGTIRIPMRDRCESLNAAAAGAVILWELGRKGL